MDSLLRDLEIDCAIDEFLRARGVTGLPQPIMFFADMPIKLDEFEDWRKAEPCAISR